jgi:hypothetical protein
MRVSQLLILFSLLFLASCNEKTKEQNDCTIVSCAGQTLSIELVNAEGENLITNESYSLETIKVFTGETQVNDLGNGTDTSRNNSYFWCYRDHCLPRNIKYFRNRYLGVELQKK